MKAANFMIFVFIVTVASKSRKHKKGNVLPDVWNDIAYQYLERQSSSSTCQGCAQMRAYLGLPEFNVTDIRIEMAKQNILKKLGLENAPVVQKIQKSFLPHPILEGEAFKQDKIRKPQRKRRLSTEQVVVMASDTTCSMESSIVNMKFSFEIPERIRKSQITSAKLWLATDRISGSYQLSTCLLTTKPCGLPSSVKSKEIYLQTSDARAGWIEQDVVWWLQGKESCQLFKLSCRDAEDMLKCSQYNQTFRKPFLIIEETSDDTVDMLREKRNINCIEGVHDCCREKLYVSFSDIGWSDWIIQPQGYEAFYCKGTCINAAAISLSGTPYHSVIKKLFLTKGQAMEITPCCTPTRLSPLQLIYMDQNGTFIQKTIQDLTVDACGCM